VASRAEILAITTVLKRRFGNLTAEELLALAFDILEALAVAQQS
jgi:hypothetical protein